MGKLQFEHHPAQGPAQSAYVFGGIYLVYHDRDYCVSTYMYLGCVQLFCQGVQSCVDLFISRTTCEEKMNKQTDTYYTDMQKKKTKKLVFLIFEQ